MRYLTVTLALLDVVLCMMLAQRSTLAEAQAELHADNQALCRRYMHVVDYNAVLESRLKQGYADLTYRLLTRLRLGEPYHGDLIPDIEAITMRSLDNAGVGGGSADQYRKRDRRR